MRAPLSLRVVWLVSALLVGLPVVAASSTAAQRAQPAPFVPDLQRRPLEGEPPNPLLITVSAENAAGQVTITGTVNAVYPRAYLAVRNLYTQATRFVQAGITGEFVVEIEGSGADTPYLISPSPLSPPANPNRALFPGSLPGGPAIILYAERPAIPASGLIPFSIGGVLAGSASWTGEGEASSARVQPGDVWSLDLDVTFKAPVPADRALVGTLTLTPLDSTQQSIVLPDEALTPGSAVEIENDRFANFVAARFRLHFETTLAASLADGLYGLDMAGYFQADDGARTPWEALGVQEPGAPYIHRLPVIVRVGDPDAMRLPVSLLADDPSDGIRGLTLDRAELPYRAQYVVPPFSTVDDTPLAYPLEPYLPSLTLNTYSRSAAPGVAFDFARSSYRLEVSAPTGATRTFTGSFVGAVASSTLYNEETRFGRQEPADQLRLTTLDPALMHFTFDGYGDYELQFETTLFDRFGNAYRSGGQAVVTAAEPLNLIPSLRPGTPLETNTTPDLSLALSPGVPAQVQHTLVTTPVSGRQATVSAGEGQASGSGLYRPSAAMLRTVAEGQYDLLYNAHYTDPDDRLWAGSWQGFGVIVRANPSDAAPDGPTAHGRRGLANPTALDDGRQPAWFTSSHLRAHLGLVDDVTRSFFPFHSGDVLWLPDGRRWQVQPVLQTDYDDARILLAASRPDILLRDSVRTARGLAAQVTTAEDRGSDRFWDNDDPFNQQIGAGFAGLRPTDFVFLQGGIIAPSQAVRRPAPSARAPSDASAQAVVGYAALAVITDENEARVMPPARGADGGPDGGALITIRGRAYDMFFHPTGTRPGDVLEPGARVIVSGYAAPLVAADVRAVVTSPSGVERVLTGRTNRFGWFYQPTDDFAADEIGAWTIHLTTQFSGVTSAGRVEAPYPTGGVLGTVEDTFYFYVVPPGNTLPWNDQLNDIALPPTLPYNFNYTVPEGWQNARVYRTLTTPSLILEDGGLRLNGRSFSYVYLPVDLARANPSLEPETRAMGASASDTKRLTLVIVGEDASGTPQVLARTFALWHDRLITLQPNLPEAE